MLTDVNSTFKEKLINQRNEKSWQQQDGREDFAIPNKFLVLLEDINEKYKNDNYDNNYDDNNDDNNDNDKDNDNNDNDDKDNDNSENDSINISNITSISSISDVNNEQLWKEFTEWGHFNKVKNFRHHCINVYKKVQNAYKQELLAQKKPLDFDEILQTHSNDKLIIADEETKKAAGSSHIKGYKYIVDPVIIKNANGETLIDFFDLTNPSNIETTQNAVNQYYHNNLENPTHQSKYFKNSKIEHFGCFTDNNLLPYITANTAASHNKNHQECVQKLIEGLQPLSNEVNNYLEKTYPILYAKMMKLDLGPNVTRSFGGFPTASINFNSICQFHQDLKDHHNTLCIVCPLGTFEGGQIAFSELKLAFNVKQGQAIAFRSCLLVHRNFEIINGEWHSVVFYIHHSSIKQGRLFSSLNSFNNWSLDNISNNGIKQLSPKLNSSKNLKNSRRGDIGKYFLY